MKNVRRKSIEKREAAIFFDPTSDPLIEVCVVGPNRKPENYFTEVERRRSSQNRTGQGEGFRRVKPPSLRDDLVSRF
jgi:hypothetical protein